MVSGRPGEHADLSAPAVVTSGVRPVVFVESVTMASGQVHQLSPGLNVFVGPNNSGKSSFLKQLVSAVTPSASVPPLILHTAQVRWADDVSDVHQWLRANYERHPAGTYHYGQPLYDHYREHGQVLVDSQVTAAWHSTTLSSFASYFLTYLDTSTRLNLGFEAPSYNVQRDVPDAPMQRLWANSALEDRLSSVVQEAFETPIYVDRYGGSTISLRLGRPASPPPVPPPSSAYVAEISALPSVQSQGDGLRSFIGIVMAIVADAHPIIVIDEPEAFLHPPQCRRLGRFLANLGAAASQIIVATHSADLLQGISSSAVSAEVSVARLTRPDPTRNQLDAVATDRLRELFSNPLLKYAGILDGLFYERVVVCEAEGDCTYYRAELDSLGDSAAFHIPDTHFVHCSGKARMWRAVRALRAASVPTSCIVDIDILQNEREFFTLLEACGGLQTDAQADYNVVSNAVRGLPSSLSTVRRLREALGQYNGLREDDPVPSELDRLIRDALRAPSGWQSLKRSGDAAIGGGAPTNALAALRSYCSALGMHIVPVGELENWHRSIAGRDKADWLRTVLEGGLIGSNASSRAFITSVVGLNSAV